MSQQYRRFQGNDPGIGKGALGLAAGALSAALLYRRYRSTDESTNGAAEEADVEEEKFDALSTYVHDHLAGARSAVDILERLRDDHEGEPIGQFVDEMLGEVRADRETLRDLAEQLGEPYSRWKEGAAWLSAKAFQAKIGRSTADPLATLQALEFLALGIHGKLALWRTLQEVAKQDSRLDGFNFKRLAHRAEDQLDDVESWRMAMAASALAPL